MKKIEYFCLDIKPTNHITGIWSIRMRIDGIDHRFDQFFHQNDFTSIYDQLFDLSKKLLKTSIETTIKNDGNDS